MKKLIYLTALLSSSLLPCLAEDDFFSVEDGNMETMPTNGIAIFEPEETRGKAKVEISEETPSEGKGSMKITCPEGAYVSVSFPMRNALSEGTVSFMLQGDVDNAKELFIGIQNYKMNPGFSSVSFKPLVMAQKVSRTWKKCSFTVTRDPDATHWQLSLTLKGPGTLWIDQLQGAQ